jgi:hypothetical protein
MAHKHRRPPRRADTADSPPRTRPAYTVRLPPALVLQLDSYLRWQRHAGADTAVHRCRAEAVRWLLSWAIDAVIRAHEARVTAQDLAALFAQSSSAKAAPSIR